MDCILKLISFCPFCEKEDKVLLFEQTYNCGYAATIEISCDNCGASGPPEDVKDWRNVEEVTKIKNSAIKKWNSVIGFYKDCLDERR